MPLLTLTTMTELEAVNILLSTLGEAPVNSLTGTLPVEVATAQSILNEVSRDVQTEGWDFNTEENVTLVRDLSNTIAVPLNCLKVDLTVEDGSVVIVQRGTSLYDKKNHTFTFTKNLRVDLVSFLPWSDITEPARRYICIKSARLFQARQLGSDTIHKFTREEELEALAKMKDADNETGDYTIFDNPGTRRILIRRT